LEISERFDYYRGGEFDSICEGILTQACGMDKSLGKIDLIFERIFFSK